MDTVVQVLLFVVGLISFLPVMGVLSADRLSSAYAIELASKDLVILMRHRALLFGIVGGFILYSVFVPALQLAAMLMAGVAMSGFLFFMWREGGYNQSLYKVMLVDVVGIVCLIGATLLKFSFGSL